MTRAMGAAMRRIHVGNALSAFGLGFTVPYLYVYVAQVRGLGAMTAGMVLAVFAVAALVVLPFAGRAIVRRSTLPVLLAALVTAALGALSLGLAGSAAAVLLSAAALGAGQAVMQPALATMIVDCSPTETRSRAFATQFFLQNLGLGVGGLIGDAKADEGGVHERGGRLGDLPEEMVHVQRRRDELIQPGQGVEATGPGVLVLGPRMGGLDEPPVDDGGDARPEDKHGVNEPPPPGVSPGRGVIIDRGGRERPHEPMMDRHIADGQQERDPFLIERDDGQHHKEVKMQLDVAPRQVHQHRGGGDEAAAGEHGAHGAAESAPGGQEGEPRDGGPVGEAMRQPLPSDQPEADEGEDVQPEQHENAQVPAPPPSVGQGPPLG